MWWCSSKFMAFEQQIQNSVENSTCIISDSISRTKSVFWPPQNVNYGNTCKQNHINKTVSSKNVCVSALSVAIYF